LVTITFVVDELLGGNGKKEEGEKEKGKSTKEIIPLQFFEGVARETRRGS
jgi:hypothetical protein